MYTKIKILTNLLVLSMLSLAFVIPCSAEDLLTNQVECFEEEIEEKEDTEECFEHDEVSVSCNIKKELKTNYPLNSVDSKILLCYQTNYVICLKTDYESILYSETNRYLKFCTLNFYS